MMNDELDKLIRELGSLFSRYSRAYGENGDRVADLLTEDTYKIAEKMKAAKAEHDRQLREQIAQEIESNIDWSDGRNGYGDNEGYAHAARIVRGSDE